MKSTLLIPTLNEIEALRVILPEIQSDWVDEILFIDGGSTDGTVEFLQEQGQKVHRQVAPGYGGAMKEGVELAEGEIIVEFTSDGSSLLTKIPELVDKIKEGHDLVIGSRYKGSADSDDDTMLTSFGNWMFTTMVNALFRAKYTDSLVGLRAYRKSKLLEVEMDAIGLSWPCQNSIRFAKAGFRVTEIPSDEPARIGGIKKMSPLKTGWEILQLIFRDLFFYHPPKKG